MKWRDDARDMSLQNVGAQLSAMGAATAQVVTLTSGGQDNTDYNAVGSAVATMSVSGGGENFFKGTKIDADGETLTERR